MFRLKTYLLLFFCFFILKFELSESIELVDFIQRNVSVANNIDDNFTKEVTLFKDIKYNILINSTQIKKNEEQAVDKVNAFYLALGCNFAEWTVMQINNFIRSFPLFYQHKFMNTEYAKAFMNYYDDFVKALNTIDDYVLRFIYTLQNVIDVDSNIFYFNDSTILKSFRSLKIKISSFTLSTNLLDVDNSDVIIIHEMLKELNVMQRFLIVNCDNLPVNINNSQGYGYLSAVKNANSTDSILDFVKSSFDWESDIKKCSIKQIFLENIITLHSTEPILNDILNAKVRTSRMKSITIRYILKKFSHSYDIDTIYWQEESILKTIIKVIHCNILVLLSDNNSLRTIMHTINEINSKISKNMKNFPIYFAKGLELLALVKDRDTFQSDIDYDTMVLKVKNNYASIDGIELKCPVKIVNGNKIQLEDNYSINESTKELFIKNTFDNLDNLMKNILKHFDDFVCYYEYFIHFRNELDKTYNKFPIEKIETDLQSVEKNTEGDSMCRFVLDLYLICYKTLTFLNRGIEKEKNNEFAQFFDKAWNSINCIKNYFLKIIKMGTDDFNLLETAHNIVIVLVNENKPTNIIHGKHLKRILCFVMVELNNYGFRHCTLPKFNFFLFNNINFNNIVMDDDVKAVIKNGDNTYNDFNIWTIEPQDYNCFSYKYLYQILIEKTDFLIPYRNIIYVYWKGNKQSILEVFEKITNLNPFYLYLLYDIYFKFFIAVVYYEVKKEYTFLTIKKLSPEINDDNEYWFQDFPKTFAPIINDIYFIKKILRTESNYDLPDCLSKTLEIENQFKQFNFVFDFSYMQNDINVISGEEYTALQTEYLKLRTDNNNFIRKVSMNVNKLYACYVKVTSQKHDKCKRVNFSPKLFNKPNTEKNTEKEQRNTKIIGRISKIFSKRPQL